MDIARKIGKNLFDMSNNARSYSSMVDTLRLKSSQDVKKLASFDIPIPQIHCHVIPHTFNAKKMSRGAFPPIGYATATRSVLTGVMKKRISAVSFTELEFKFDSIFYFRWIWG